MYKKLLIISVIIAATAIYLNENVQTYILTKLGYPRRNGAPAAIGLRLFSTDELKLYNGIDKPQLYLAILGVVFDVTKGDEYYGFGKSYSFFTGKDACRSFVTGKFGENDASDLVADFNQEELKSLNYWMKFYRKQYKRIGKLMGTYYNEKGKLTPYGKAVKKLIEAAELAKHNKDLEMIKFPPCNVEWDAIKGSRVWCTDRSGGIKRSWVGVPRQLYEPGSSEYRCACINPDNIAHPNVREYDNCDKNRESCYVKD